MSNKQTINYNKLASKVRKCYPDLKPELQQIECDEHWKSTFTNYEKREGFDMQKYKDIIKKLDEENE